MSPRGRDAGLFLSVRDHVKQRFSCVRHNHTDIKQAGAIFLLVDNVVGENLVIQGPRFWLCGRHIGLVTENEV